MSSLMDVNSKSSPINARNFSQSNNSQFIVEQSHNNGTFDLKNTENHPKIIFRNYVPKREELKKFCVPCTKPIEFIEDFKELIEKSKKLNHDLQGITPKKCNWDLKRDCETQIQQLKYETQLAIRKLIQMKQSKQQMEDDSQTESDSESGSIDDSEQTSDSSKSESDPNSN